MVIRRNASSPRLQSDAHVSENGAPKPRISPAGQKVRTTPLSQKLFRQTNTQRNYSKIAPRSVAGSSHSTHRVPHSNNASLSKSSGMAPTATQSGPPVNVCLTEPLYGDMKVSESLPSRSTLEKIADLPVFNVDGKTKPFKSLYWADAKESKRVFIIFIRHFFCGVLCPSHCCIDRTMTYCWIELPRIPADSRGSHSSIFSATRHVNPNRWLWFSYTHPFVR